MRAVALLVSLLVALAVASLALVASIPKAPAESASSIPDVPAKNTVTMVDLGAKACIPCKMMIPVMEWAEKEYEGKAAIVFIDVWKAPEQKGKFGLRAIPTQIFYDRAGNEVYRHEGFLDKKPISEILDKLLEQ
jgi:thioredoxin 1